MKITKPIEFLGAYVSNVSMGIGWGSESGFCNLEIIEEPKDGKIFTPPSLGKGCIFKFGKAEFGGLLQRYSYSEDVSGGRRYKVDLQSPNTIIAGVQVILSAFQGTFYNSDYSLDNLSFLPIMTYGKGYPTNIINIYAEKENYEYGGFFGGTGNNSSGYPVANFLSDINSAIKRGIFGGKINFAGVEYDLDLSELAEPISYIPQFRINQNFTDLGSIISNICEMASYDYTLVLTGKTNNLGVIVSDAKIKVKVISRQSPPNPNIISSIVNDYKSKPDKSKILSSYTLGKEYADIVTQKILVGAKASRYWLADRSYILPIWGSLGTGENTTYFHGNSIYEYRNMFTPIRVTIDGGSSSNFTYVDTNLLELRCALGGRQCWTAYHVLMAKKQNRPGITIGNFVIRDQDFTRLLEGNLAPQEIMDTGIENALTTASWLYGREAPLKVNQAYAQKVIDTRFNSIVSAANTFYGRQFLVAVPGEVGGIQNSIRWVESFKYENAWDIASSAWAGDYNFDDFPDVSFYDDSGKFQSVVVYPNYENGDYSELKNRYGRTRLGTNYGVFTSANIDTNWGIKWLPLNIFNIDISGSINVDSSGRRISTSSTVGYVKVEIEPIPIYDEYTTIHNGFNKLCSLIFGREFKPGYHNLFGFNNIDFPMPPSYMAPEFIGVPQESNRYVWGPWFSFNPNSGQSGKAEITEDANISPETFGSTLLMNLYAQYGLNAELATLTENETGSIELAEEPKFNLAERFFGSGPYVTNIAISADAGGGYKTNYQFSTWTKTFGALAKYNISLFTKMKYQAFEANKKIRELYRNPVPMPVNTKLLSLIEKKIQKDKILSSPMMAATAYNYMAKAINGSGVAVSGSSSSGTNVNESKLGVGVSATTVEEGMRGLATNYTEGFAVGYEGLYSPVFTYNQIDPAKMKRNFNTGQV